MTTSIFTACQPRQDILDGTISEADFAARLGSVISGVGSPDYVDPARFFSNTHPTAGLRTLIGEVMRRLSGKGDGSATFRLDTSFGGGKTHGLIALVHAARWGSAHGNELRSFVGDDALDAVDASVAAFDGEAADPTNGRLMGDGIRAFTPWGEIAYQLGGPEGYETVRKSDEARRAPGSSTLGEVLGDGPCLILLDELGEYLRKCPDALGRDQLAAFLKALFTAVEGRGNAAVVFTLAVRHDGKATDAFARENEEIARIIGELESVSGRKATILNPTSDDETAAVLRTRLFERVEVPGVTVDAYATLWNDNRDRIDAGHQGADARDAIETSYPFHPDLLDTLTGKTSTLADFQRVRGMLRILAKTVAKVWADRPDDDGLIHTHHIDLGDEGIRREFTTRLNQLQYDSAILNDIDGKSGRPALAATIDEEKFSGLLPYTSYIARTVFVHTLAFNNDLRGLTPAHLRYSILSPQADLSFVAAAETAFIQGSAYLDDRPTAPLRFNAEANLTQIIAREERGVEADALRTELDSRIKDIFTTNSGSFETISFPAGAFDVPDDVGDGKPRLVLVHHQALDIGNNVEEVPDLIAAIYQRKGQDGVGLRQLRNNLVFLAADERNIKRMTDAISRHLALQELRRPDRIGELAEHQQSQVVELARRSEADIAVAIQQCYRHLFYPSRTALGGGPVTLDLATIDQTSASERPGSGQTQIVRQLSDIGKLKKPEDQSDQPSYIRDRTPLKRSGQITSADLRAEFRRDPALPMHVGDDPFRKLVLKGIADGVFVYRRETMVAGQGDPAPSIVIDDASMVFTSEYARDHGIFPRPTPTSSGGDDNTSSGGSKPDEHGEGTMEIAGEEKKQTAGTGTATSTGGGSSSSASDGETFMGEGVLKDALTTVFQKARSAKVGTVSRLSITPFEISHFYMLLAVVESIPGATRRATASIEFETADASIITMTIEGTVGDAKLTREYVEPQLRAATERNVSTAIELTFADGLTLDGDEPEKIIERLTKFGTAAAFVEVTAEG
ncbi:DUF499 domain-containing protein [Erythrobacter citreus]|uniref:DUF499 domain-containing protein n=1 Tax=Qipengyuania citrea TaxID=225971 RepID=A0A6I4UBS6_9SPHN|nr:DUF499 domain-containing protein [Qipengyuania citrea]MDQ0566859.1 hypothetical protein [Qipengyuania citrea]MXP35205.1 DUF499 domain-containing protein [Qipengyuania citrea]